MHRLWSPSEYSASVYSSSEFGSRSTEARQGSSNPTSEFGARSTLPQQVPRNRFSAFFHGTSVLTDRTGRPSQHGHKPFRGSPPSVLPRLDMSHLDMSAAPSQRSPTSTRSLIDPSSTPASSASPFSVASFDRSPGISPLSAQAHLLSPRTYDLEPEPIIRRKTARRVRHAPRWQPRHSSGRVCFPFMRKKGMRGKVFYCILSGSILAISLIICKAEHLHILLVGLTPISSRTCDVKHTCGARVPNRPYPLPPDLHSGILPLSHPTVLGELQIKKGRSDASSRQTRHRRIRGARPAHTSGARNG